MIQKIHYSNLDLDSITKSNKPIKVAFCLVKRSITQIDDFLLVQTEIELGHFKIRINWIDARSDIPVATFVRLSANRRVRGTENRASLRAGASTYL